MLAAKYDDGAGLVLAARLKDCGAYGCGATFEGFGGTICGFGAAAFDRFEWGTGVLKDVTGIVRSFSAAISASSRSF